MGEVYTAADQVFVWLGHGKSEEMEQKTVEDLNRILDLHEGIPQKSRISDLGTKIHLHGPQG